MHPTVGIPTPIPADLIDDLGADPVLEGPRPTVTRYQTAYRDGVSLIGGQWFAQYSVAEMDANTKAATDAAQAEAVRAMRDQRLTSSDWTQVADSPVDKPSWAAYRTALRDVPAQSGFPWDVIWPEAPK
jgi:hypothetical protein